MAREAQSGSCAGITPEQKTIPSASRVRGRRDGKDEPSCLNDYCGATVEAAGSVLPALLPSIWLLPYDVTTAFDAKFTPVPLLVTFTLERRILLSPPELVDCKPVVLPTAELLSMLIADEPFRKKPMPFPEASELLTASLILVPSAASPAKLDPPLSSMRVLSIAPVTLVPRTAM